MINLDINPSLAEGTGEMTKKAKGLNPDRSERDLAALIRRKNAATSIGVLRKTYGDGFAQGFKDSTKLDALLNQTGTATLSEYLKRAK